MDTHCAEMNETTEAIRMAVARTLFRPPLDESLSGTYKPYGETVRISVDLARGRVIVDHYASGGRPHRVDGPAHIVLASRAIRLQWCLDGAEGRHGGGPSTISINLNQSVFHFAWRIDGALRRLDGPAMVLGSGYMSWVDPQSTADDLLVELTAAPRW